MEFGPKLVWVNLPDLSITCFEEQLVMWTSWATPLKWEA